MLSYAFIDGFTRIHRDEAIERLKLAIAFADGVIVDFAFFARDAIRLTVELDVGALEVLRGELAAAEIELVPACVADLAAAKAVNAQRPIVAMVHVAFVPADADFPAEGAHPV